MLPDPEHLKKKYVYTALVLYWLVLLAATSLPTSSLPDIGGGDKIKHFSAYAILTMLLTLSLMVQEKIIVFKKNPYVFSVILACFYGFFDEIHQAFIPGRNCEFWDWLADFGGAVAGSFVIFLFYKEKKRKLQEH